MSTTNGLAAFIDIAMAWSWRERSIHASSNAAVVVAMSVGRDWRGWVFNVEQGVGVGEVGLGACRGGTEADIPCRLLVSSLKSC